MNLWTRRSSKFVTTFPTRLYRALPAVILGTLFNILDTVSIGILLFPATDGVFKTLQLQGLSMFIMSTLTSQIAMTLGGSRFPGALGAMLMEILPFLRGVANDIRGALGDDHPGLVPTVMAAYALTSFLTGFAFVVLGLLRLGTVVAYFPQTVLTGAIGAIGVSMFVLGLGLPFPPSATPLVLGNVATTLFAKEHLGLLAASFFPAFILSVSLRSKSLEVWTRGAVQSAYYIPVYLLCIPVVFWITARALHTPHAHLVATGWLFSVDTASISSPTGVVSSWNYWMLFDFRLVEWHALRNALQNIILLVVIGVLNLPIFVPSLAFSLDVAYDMNHELIGQGVANLLAGVVGTVPNILQFSYSVYVTRAKGDRFALCLIILLTGGLLLSTGELLPYVPTTLASTTVLFLGTELFLGALWEASASLAPMEWGVVLGTLAACTFLGFAEGFGVGIGGATVVYLGYGVVDSPARTEPWGQWSEEYEASPIVKSPAYTPPRGSRTQTPDIIAPSDDVQVSASASIDTRTVENSDRLEDLNARVVALSGYIFFASVPSTEKKLLLDSKAPGELIILDLTGAHRIETTAAQCLKRCVRELELKGSRMVICGLAQDSGLHADFARAEVPLGFDATREIEEKEILVFASRRACLGWCRKQRDKGMFLDKRPAGMEREMMEAAFEKFCHLFGFDPSTALAPSTEKAEYDWTTASALHQFIQHGGQICTHLPGQLVDPGTTLASFD
ncbi:hypothetical protein C8R46DRAFT_1344499 [Mycena filopes]|nr:hypothetical protein C8R46DRAFT_1344499 [Mycena filopes]